MTLATVVLLDAGALPILARGGMILGPNPGSQYERGYDTLEHGSILLAYTDGIVEAVDASDEAFGMDRLRKLIREGAFASAKDIVEAVFAAVRRHVGGDTRDDDQTVVAVLRKVKAAAAKAKAP
jgi:serine phosphatase RsbU (regulator of sigma subunit)